MHIYNPFSKVIDLRKGKMHIAHHCMPNCIYACILPHACVKSPERACIKGKFCNYV